MSTVPCCLGGITGGRPRAASLDRDRSRNSIALASALFLSEIFQSALDLALSLARSANDSQPLSGDTRNDLPRSSNAFIPKSALAISLASLLMSCTDQRL